MNKRVVMNVLWKEYRALRGLWLAMLALALIVEAFADWQELGISLSGSLTGVNLRFWPVLAGFVVLGFYSLGCGCTAFAWERDSGTYGFLRALPTTAWEIAAGKFAFFFVSLLALLAIGAAGLYGLNRPSFAQLLHMQNIAPVIALYFVMAANLYFCGALFSLLSSQPLASGIFGAVLASVGNYLLMAECDQLTWFFQNPYPRIPLGVAFVAVVAWLCVLLVPRWFEEKKPSGEGLGLRLPKIFRHGPTLHWPQGPRDKGFFRHLVLQHLRQSAWLIAGIYAAFTLTIANYAAKVLHISHTRYLYIDQDGFVYAAFFILTPLCGALAFLEDHRKSGFRFFGTRGASAGQLWRARTLVSFLVWLPLVVGVLITFRAAHDNITPTPSFFNELIVFTMTTVTCFCVGMFCATAVRGAILAVALAGGLSIGCYFLIAVSHSSLGMYWPAFFFPPFFFVASRLRIGSLLVDRGGWKGWRATTLWLIAAPIVAFSASAVYRSTEFADVTPGYWTVRFDDYDQAEAQKTGELYDTLWEKYAAPSEELRRMLAAEINDDGELASEQGRKQLFQKELIPWLENNRQTLAKLQAIGQRGECEFKSPTAQDRFSQRSEAFGYLLIFSGRQKLDSGDLAGALETYLAVKRFLTHVLQANISGTNALPLRPNIFGENASSSLIAYERINFRLNAELFTWATRPGQTSANIVVALRKLKKAVERGPTWLNVFAQIAKQQENETLSQIQTGKYNTSFRGWLITNTPWERNRAFRYFLQKADSGWREFFGVLATVEEGKRPIVQSESNSRYRTLYFSYGPLESIRTYVNSNILSNYYHYMTVKTQERVMPVLLALAAWQWDHDGELPGKLDDLVGPYLEKMPLDPATGKAFHYLPKGIAPNANINRGASTFYPFSSTIDDDRAFETRRGVPAVTGTCFLLVRFVRDDPRRQNAGLIREPWCKSAFMAPPEDPESSDEADCLSPWFEIPRINQKNEGGK